MNRYPLHAALIFLLAATGAGCSHLSESGSPDLASGFYDGDWYAGNSDRALGELTCTIVRRDAETWDATFFATFGGFGEYDVPLEGKLVGDKVVFDGSVDLGETSGGVFDWLGEIVDDQFTGSYTSKFINGTFKMVRTSPDAASN